MNYSSHNPANPSLSILLFGTQMATGGAQKVLLDQAKWFHDHGHKVTAVFLYDKENLGARWQANFKFPVYALEKYQNKDTALAPINVLANLWKLWKLLRRERFDVIETFTHDSNILALPIAWLANTSVRIATHHGIIGGFPSWREKLHTWLINHNAAHVLVAVSARTRVHAIAEGIKSDRVRVVRNGITPVDLSGLNRHEIRVREGIGENDLFLLTVGRLVHQKGHDVLIRSMPAILDKFPNVKVAICGEGVLRSKLEREIVDLDLSDSVKLYGVRNDIESLLAIADMFVLPSRWEGLPVALLEAMSVGLPVVATRVEGVDEVIDEGKHGLLVAVENPREFSDAVIQLLNDAQARKEMGAAAESHILEIYTENRMCQQYLDIMLEYLKRK